MDGKEAVNPQQQPLPALRPVEITPVRGAKDEELRYLLYDRTQIAPNGVAVSPAGYFVLAHLDGKRTCADIQAAFRQYTGMHLPEEQILHLVRVLDDALLLHGERYERAYAQRRAEYRAASCRDNRDRYPSADALRKEIEAILAQGRLAEVSEVRGLIVPHLDYARGAPCYADAYATLARYGLAERYILLGTNHFGRSEAPVATNKDFRTPLGDVTTDRGFLARLADHLGDGLTEDELDHVFEHSLELQVHVLQVLHRAQPPVIVPILCPNPCVEEPRCAADRRSQLCKLAGALRELLAQDGPRTIVVAGADLSHMGERFGDAGPITPQIMEVVGQADRQLLRLLEDRKEEEFVRRLTAFDNPTRICSAGCMYALAHVLPDRPCRVLRYHQAVDYESHTHVTCAAAVYC